jgi:hypothetical protein
MRKINHQGKCREIHGGVGTGVGENGLGVGDVEVTMPGEGEAVGDVVGVDDGETVGVGEVEVVGDGEGGRTGVGEIGKIGVGAGRPTSTYRVSLTTSPSMRPLLDKPIWT